MNVKRLNAAIDNPIVQLAGSIAVAAFFLLSLYFGLERLIDRRVDQRFRDKENLREVASLVRPYVIFDHNGSIRYDGGAMGLLEKPPEVLTETVQFSGQPARAVKQIVVRPKAFSSSGPLLQVLEGVETHIEPKRGSGLELVYDIWGGVMTDKRQEILFRLEILN